MGNIFKYIAENNPKEANKLINSYGYEGGTNKEEVTKFLSLLALREKDTFMRDLMKIHPDRPMLMEESVDEFNSPYSMNYMNCDGCACSGCKSKAIENKQPTYQNGDGDSKSVQQNDKFHFAMDSKTLIGVGLVILAIVLISKK